MQNIYQEKGYKNREEYLKSLAEEYGVDLADVKALATLFGPSEDFDGLIVTLQDYDIANDLYLDSCEDFIDIDSELNYNMKNNCDED